MATIDNGTPTELRILRRDEVERKTGLSRSGIYERTNPNGRPGYYDPTFPKPLKLGPRAVGWLAHEIDAWLIAQLANRKG